MMCNKCSKMSGALLLIVGLAFLLADLGVWGFWGLNWWTVVLILFGLGTICSAGCPDCQACCGVPAKAPAKKK